MNMSTVWMRMPGQTWPTAAASFLGMWVIMMVVMMSPSLVSMLWRARLGWFAPVVGVAYYFIWAVLGAAVYPVGVTLAAVEMQHPTLARVAPAAGALIVVVAAVLQFTVCRTPKQSGPAPVDTGSAWSYGLRLGLDCARCCAGFMTILLVIGITNLGAMAVVTAAITVKRFIQM